MRVCLFASLLFLLSCVTSQQAVRNVPKEDSLAKYSYLIYGFGNQSHLHTGTGFFIKAKERVYIISNNHVFSGQDSYYKKIPDFPDTLFINLEEKSTGKKVKYPIDVAAYRRIDTGAFNFNQADIFITEIKDPDKYIINSIEKYLDNREIQDSDIDFIEGHGYYYKTVRDLNSIYTLPPLRFEGTTKGEYNFNMFLPLYNKIDSINYYIYPRVYSDLKGASGSPVFLHLKTNRVIFGGLYTASNPTEKIYIIVRKENLFNRIRKGLLMATRGIGTTL